MPRALGHFASLTSSHSHTAIHGFRRLVQQRIMRPCHRCIGSLNHQDYFIKSPPRPPRRSTFCPCFGGELRQGHILVIVVVHHYIHNIVREWQDVHRRPLICETQISTGLQSPGTNAYRCLLAPALAWETGIGLDACGFWSNAACGEEVLNTLPLLRSWSRSSIEAAEMLCLKTPRCSCSILSCHIRMELNLWQEPKPWRLQPSDSLHSLNTVLRSEDQLHSDSLSRSAATLQYQKSLTQRLWICRHAALVARLQLAGSWSIRWLILVAQRSLQGWLWRKVEGLFGYKATGVYRVCTRPQQAR